jgi:hypothetical protein
MRMHMRRFTRLTNAFSKKVENHVHSLALFTTYYNFVKVHSKLRMSPAMAAGVADRLWDIAEIVKLVEAAEARSTKRGPYKKRLALDRDAFGRAHDFWFVLRLESAHARDVPLRGRHALPSCARPQLQGAPASMAALASRERRQLRYQRRRCQNQARPAPRAPGLPVSYGSTGSHCGFFASPRAGKLGPITVVLGH